MFWQGQNLLANDGRQFEEIREMGRPGAADATECCERTSGRSWALQFPDAFGAREVSVVPAALDVSTGKVKPDWVEGLLRAREQSP